MNKVFLYILVAFFIRTTTDAHGSGALSSMNVRSCGLVSSSENIKNTRIEKLNDLAGVRKRISTIWVSQRDIEEGRLSDYWAQELIGVDLLKEELEKEPVSIWENFIAVFDDSDDTNIDSHGVPVKNLLSDEGPHAVLSELNDKVISQLRVEKGHGFIVTPGKKLPSKHKILEGYFTAAENLLKDQVLPAFINNSGYWLEFQGIYDVFKSLSPPAVVAVAAENYYPQRLDIIKSKASKDFNIILVGSFSPGGFVSAFSQEGEEVEILAPSDYWLTTIGDKGQHKIFGGTSGATPLVTGSLVGFELFSNYHPIPEEAKILLEKTAIPTPHIHEQPRRNGVGLVNSYKLGMVGKQLKQKCVNQLPNCPGKVIRGEEIYNFPKPLRLQTDLQNMFPRCVAKKRTDNIVLKRSCEEIKKVFNKLRKTVLLDPSREDLWKTLSCIYKEGGFTVNGMMLESIAIAGSRKSVVDAVYSLSQSSNIEKKRLAARLAGNIGGEEGIQILDILSRNLDILDWYEKERVREAITVAERAMRGEEEAYGIPDDLFEDSDYDIQIQ